MLDGALGDSQGCWSSSEEVVWMKRLIVCDDLYVNINQASEMTCRSLEFFHSVPPSQLLAPMGASSQSE